MAEIFSTKINHSRYISGGNPIPSSPVLLCIFSDIKYPPTPTTLHVYVYCNNAVAVTQIVLRWNTGNNDPHWCCKLYTNSVHVRFIHLPILILRRKCNISPCVVFRYCTAVGKVSMILLFISKNTTKMWIPNWNWLICFWFTFRYNICKCKTLIS